MQRVIYSNSGGRFGASARPSSIGSRSTGPRFVQNNQGSPNPADIINQVGQTYQNNIGNINDALTNAASGVGSNKNYASLINGAGGNWLPGDPNPPSSPRAPQAANIPGLGAIDYSGDPILLKIQALAADHIAQAEAAAMAQRKQLLIGFGDEQTSDNLLGDKATSQAAQENPFSVVARLNNAKDQSGKQLDQGLSQANLWFSGEHGKQSDLASQRYLQSQYDAQGALQNQLGQVASQLLQAKQSEQDRIAAEEENAYMRAIQMALAMGFGGAGGGASSGGSSTAAGGPTGPGPSGAAGTPGVYNAVTGANVPRNVITSPYATGPVGAAGAGASTSALLKALSGVPLNKRPSY